MDREENADADAAWLYPDPEPSADVIERRVVFWPGTTIMTAL